MISKTKINERMRKKTNPSLADAIFLAKKNNALELAKKLSISTRQQASVNLTELNKMKEDKIVVVGKVLGSGDIKRKFSVYALGFSEQAKEKLKKAGCEVKTIKEALEKDTKFTGIKII